MPILADGTVDDTDLGPDSGFEEFLQNLVPGARKEPPEGAGDDTTNDEQHDEPTKDETKDEETPSDDEDKDGEEKEPTEDDESNEGKETDKDFAKDGAFFKIKVGDEEHEVPVKDLARLYGQEAALTQRGQKLAEDRKSVDTQVQTNAAVTNALLQRAMARYEPYSKVDFNLAAQQLSPEEYTALRNEAQSAYQDVAFLKEHTDAYAQHIQQTQATTLRERASATLKALADPEKGIKGWNEAKYNDMVKFATTKYGIPSEVMNSVVDEFSFRILNDAMAYHAAKDVNANVKVTKVNKTAKRIVKTTTPPDAARAQKSSGTAMARLAKTGSTEDATSAFLESLTDRD